MVWHRGLGRYLVAATLARTADAGAPLGLVLLAASADVRGAATGLLVAGLSAPHVLGPLLARRLDAARDGRGVLASAFVAYGVALAVATGLLASGRPGPAAVAVGGAGARGPPLAGGLRRRLGAPAPTAGNNPPPP